jgi:branched-chain amino acid transport system substrate-binding protein
MKRKLLAILVGTALLGMVTNLALGQGSAKRATAKASAISGDVVKIGVLNDMSGLYADIGGPGSVLAAQMAVQDFGGTVLGKPIEIVFADHQNKVDVGANKAREWFDTQGVDMITDVTNSGVSLAVAKIAGEKKRVFLSTAGSTIRLTNEDCNAYTVAYVYDTYAMANGTGKAIVKQGGKSWFFITADYAFGHSLESDTAAVVKANGGTVIGHVLQPLNASDLSSYVLQAQASKAQIIGLANAGGDAINTIKTANEFGLTKTQTIAGLLMFISDIHSLGLKTAQGMMLTDAWYWDMNEETRKFGRRFFEKMKRMPTFDHAGVYSAVTTYLKAIKATGTDDADTIMVELKKTKVNDMFAKNGYVRQDGRMMHDMYLMQVKKPEESKYPWDYYNIKAVIPAEEAFQPLSKSTCPMIKK